MTRERHIAFLEGTLIPDLKESGHEYTAEDFETLVEFLRGEVAVGEWDQPQFIAYLEGTLIPDLKESGREATAEDFKTGIGFLRGHRNNPVATLKSNLLR